MMNGRRDFLKKMASCAVFASPMLHAKDSYIGNDIYLNDKDYKTLKTLKKRFHNLKKAVGFGNFNIISYDKSIYLSKKYHMIGAFTNEEVALMHRFFYEDVSKYGFYGEQTVQDIASVIDKKKIVKISGSGHYIYKEESLESYNLMLRDVETKSVILTSGVRSVIKQMDLYINKIYFYKGNITKASRDIAPPAYSYHSTGDYDLGKIGFGYANFTPRFALTREFRELQELSYLDMRYTIFNKDGVRYEPWHIKVNKDKLSKIIL